MSTNPIYIVGLQFRKEKKMKLTKSLKNYLEKILAFVGDGGPFINMALALELQFPMKGDCMYISFWSEILFID